MLAARNCAALRIRYWAALAITLATAALVDWSSELLANAGWLGAGVPDGYQEAVLPVALLAALAFFGLCVAVALCAGRGDRVRYEAGSWVDRVLVAVATLGATFAVIVLMEAYEMRFGGVSAFDPRSVFVEHAPAILIGYAIVATIVGRLVTLLLRAAAAAGCLAAHAIVRILRMDPRQRAATSRRDAGFAARVACRCPIIAFGAIALRAPPFGQSFLQQLLA